MLPRSASALHQPLLHAFDGSQGLLPPPNKTPDTGAAMRIAMTLLITQTSWIRSAGAALCAALVTTLAACGGGGTDGPGEPCGGSQTLSLAVAYEVNGTLLDVARVVYLPRNVPVNAVPRIVGLPPACAGAAQLTVSGDSLTSPSGLVLNRSTGVISGIATQRGAFDVRFKITVDGYINPVFQNIDVFF